MKWLVDLVEPESVCVFESAPEEEGSASSWPCKVEVHLLLNTEDCGLVRKVKIHDSERKSHIDDLNDV